MSRVPALDGLRGVAILLVMVFHAWPKLLPGGGYGVTLFFVLSGFLITGILDREQRATGQIDFRRFYWRRALRLFPALVVFVAAMSWYADWGQIWPALGYMANWVDISGRDMGALGHTWSLSVEEHFYMVWPLILVAFPARWRFRSTLALLVAATGWRMVMIGSAGFERVNYGTDTAAFALLAGCALALAPRVPVSRRVGYLAIGGIVLFGFLPITRIPAFLWIEIAVVGMAALAIASAVDDGLPLIEGRVLTWFGTVSYGLYLWHMPLMREFPMLHEFPLWAGVASTFAVTIASWRFIEQPTLRLRERQRGLASESAAGTAPSTKSPTAPR